MHQAHDGFFMLVTDTIEQQRTADTHLQAHPEAPSPGGQRQALGAAATVPGGHEHGGCFAPDLYFFPSRGLAFRLQRAHGHQQAGRAAGELGGLGVVGHLRLTIGVMLQDAFFQAQGIGMVFVVVVDQAEAAIAVVFVEGDGRVVVGAYLQAQVRAVMFQGTGFAALQQLFTEADATCVGRDGNRIQACQRSAAVKQHQGIAGQLPVDLLGDDQPGVGPTDHPVEAAGGQAIGGETMLFQLQQCSQVIGCRKAKDEIHITTVKVA